MKNVLVISHVPTHPQNAGNSVRIFNIVDNMKKNNINVYFLYIKRNDEADINEMKSYIGENNLFIYEAKRTRNPIYLLKKIIRKFISITKLSKKVIIHYSIDEVFPRGLKKYIKQLKTKYDFNVVLSVYIWYSKAFKLFDDNVIKIIDTQDLFTKREQLFLKNGEAPKWFYTTQKQELKGLNRANKIIAIQSNEAEFFKKIINNNNKQVVVIGNPINVVEPSIIKNKKYLFVGSNNDLNIHAVNYFIENILQKVKKKEPNSEFLIAGGVCNSIKDSNDYIKLGYVDDLKEVYKNVRAVVNPIKSGTGLNIKTIEALGYSKPLITTSCGAKGLEKPHQFCIIADKDEDFSDKLVEVLNDDNLACEYAKNAYKFVKEYNDITTRSLNDIL